jgi:hypothetical protein
MKCAQPASQSGRSVFEVYGWPITNPLSFISDSQLHNRKHQGCSRLQGVISGPRFNQEQTCFEFLKKKKSRGWRNKLSVVQCSKAVWHLRESWSWLLFLFARRGCLQLRLRAAAPTTTPLDPGITGVGCLKGVALESEQQSTVRPGRHLQTLMEIVSVVILRFWFTRTRIPV